jgi:FAD/FMN-containing dehydrogenase
MLLNEAPLAPTVGVGLTDQLEGRVILPGSVDYDSARQIWNGMIQRQPSLIVQPHSTVDVVAAVNHARQNGLPVSVRGGGHNVSGSALNDGGMVIDMREMNAIAVDAIAKTVAAQGGATIGDLDHATQAHGLAVPMGVVSKTGIAGLTLGGGFGWLRNQYGLSADNLRAVELVTWDGHVVTASADDNADLFWLLRGSGVAPGVVTRFDYTAHPVGPDVMMVFALHDGTRAQEALGYLQAFSARAPEVSILSALGYVPSAHHFPHDAHGKPYVLFAAMYPGNAAEGERILQPLRDFGTPLADFSGIMPYLQAQTLYDEDYPDGLRYYWKSLYVDVLDSEVVAKLMTLAAEMPSKGSTIDIWFMGGAMHRIPTNATSFGNRHSPFMIGIESNWEAAADDDANIAWARRVAEVMMPYSDGTQYANFPGLWEDGAVQRRAVYGANHERVEAIKAKYDPAGVFGSS